MVDVNKHCTYARLVYCRTCRHRHKVACEIVEVEGPEPRARVFRHSAYCHARFSWRLVQHHESTGNWMPV